MLKFLSLMNFSRFKFVFQKLNTVNVPNVGQKKFSKLNKNIFVLLFFLFFLEIICKILENIRKNESEIYLNKFLQLISINIEPPTFDQ